MNQQGNFKLRYCSLGDNCTADPHYKKFEPHEHCPHPTCNHIFSEYSTYGHPEAEAEIHIHCATPECNITNQFHVHCDQPGCEQTLDAHRHCNQCNNLRIIDYHSHCTQPGCARPPTEYHTHCPDCSYTGGATHHHHCDTCDWGGVGYHEHCGLIDEQTKLPCIRTYRHMHCELCGWVNQKGPYQEHICPDEETEPSFCLIV